MKTLDGQELNDGDECFVQAQDPEGVARLNPAPRRAFYRSDNAKRRGDDFEIPTLRFESWVEVIAVWKDRPST